MLKGDSECQYVTIDLKNAKYLKFEVSSNGDKGYDHSVIANGKFISSDYKEPSASDFKFIKTVSQYESELAGLSDYESETYRKILYQKNFVERTGFDFFTIFFDLICFIASLSFSFCSFVAYSFLR